MKRHRSSRSSNSLHGFVNQLLAERNEAADLSCIPVVEDNARSHGSEEFHNSFIRCPPTPSSSSSLHRRQLLARWDDSFEVLEKSPPTPLTKTPDSGSILLSSSKSPPLPKSMFSPNSVISLQQLISTSRRRRPTQELGGAGGGGNTLRKSRSKNKETTASILDSLPLDDLDSLPLDDF
jgi:hypothetical protein